MRKIVISITFLALFSIACSSQNNTVSISSETSLGNKGERFETLQVEREKVLKEATLTPPSSEDSNPQVNSIGSFAFQSVKWNDVIYRLSEEEVQDIDIEIGVIEQYSNIEMDETPNNYSNFLKEGTKLWSLKGVDTNDAIAIQTDENVYQLLKNASLNK